MESSPLWLHYLSLTSRECFSRLYIYIYTVFPRKDVMSTIYFSANAMRRLFEGGAYSRAAFNSVTGTHM